VAAPRRPGGRRPRNGVLADRHGEPGAHAPLPAPTPATVEIDLRSVPAGASVYLGDVLVGVTPTRQRVRRVGDGNEPLEYVFRLEGYEPERIKALPTRGLTVTARFATPRVAKRSSLPKRKPAKRIETEPSTDIQTER
jgi:hypothetical protein